MVARGATAYEVYTREGASSAARSLGISRAGLYKLIAEHAPPEVKEARRKAIANVVTAVAAAAVAVQLVTDSTSDDRKRLGNEAALNE